jgi:nucleoside-diphosphate-sugar epimerase
LKDIDTVVHLAARVHVRDDGAVDPMADFRETNVAGTAHLAKTAASMGVRRFVFLSSVKVYGEGRASAYNEDDIPTPLDPYAISKYEAEQVLLEIADNSAMEMVIISCPLVYGPGVKANFLQLLKVVGGGIPLPFTGIENRRSLIFLGNLVEAVNICIDHPRAAGQRYLISDGQDVSTPELARKIAAALGKPARLFYVPPRLLRVLARLTGKSGTGKRLLDSLFVDSSKIRTELDWTPPFTMQEGLAETARWYWEVNGN